MTDMQIVETIGQLRGNLTKKSDSTHQYNTMLETAADAMSILFNRSFDESPHLKSARMYRQKIIDEVLGPRTKVIAAVDNKDVMHIRHQLEVDAEFEKLRSSFIKKTGKIPYADIDKRMLGQAADIVSARNGASTTVIRSGQFVEGSSDRLVQLFDNGTVDVLNLFNKQIITRMVASVPYLELVKETVVFDAMFSPDVQYMSRRERLRATKSPNSKQRKKLGTQVEDIEAIIPRAAKLDSVEFDPQILKGHRHWGNLGDFHNILWDELDDDSYETLVRKPLIEAGLIKKDGTATNGIVECIAGMMSERNRLTTMM